MKFIKKKKRFMKITWKNMTFIKTIMKFIKKRNWNSWKNHEIYNKKNSNFMEKKTLNSCKNREFH